MQLRELPLCLRLPLVWSVFLTIVFSAVVCNAAQLVVALVLYPFVSAKQRLGVMQAMANFWWNIFAFAFENACGVQYVFTGDRLSLENSILIGNHTSTLDFTNGVMVTGKVAGLGCGRMMTFMKQSLMYFPTVGWTHYLQGSLFLKRSWDQDFQYMQSKLSDMEEGRFPSPFWVGIYPEGTRITARKKAESQEFAKSNNLPILNNMLLPRTKGFVTVRQSLSTAISSIYDVTVAYEANAPISFGYVLKNGKFKSNVVHLHIRRTDINRVPTNEGELKQWVLDTFVAKDKLLDYFHQTGYFPGDVVRYESSLNSNRLLYIFWLFVLTYLLHVLVHNPLVTGAYVLLGVATLLLSFPESKASGDSDSDGKQPCDALKLFPSN